MTELTGWPAQNIRVYLLSSHPYNGAASTGTDLPVLGATCPSYFTPCGQLTPKGLGKRDCGVPRSWLACLCSLAWCKVKTQNSQCQSMSLRLFHWKRFYLPVFNLLVLDDVVAVGSTCISVLVCCGHHRSFFVWCERHRRYHQIGILSTSTDPVNSLAIFDHSLEYALGLAEYQEEFFMDLGDQYSEYYGDDSEINWRGFIVYRAWCIYYGFEPELR